jgi:DNA polymerase-3 subunit gamma/tau
MENFIVSARKYRPDSFRNVVGQAAITSTLKNAIKNKHLGHAYLFSGPRGVGKTTCARIFAKTINCMNLSETVEACNECESCKSLNESRAFNIHELDAASNNSVDGIRSLTEQVRIPPQVGKYSVYIIDEVHMLSQQAFNAFLKTLEEPPAHAIFILATTEKHKIIPTILSRCQIYDFNRIKTEDTVDYLKYIAGEEGISFEEDALHIIAQKAEGAMRDALSIFDQVVSFSENKITYAAVIENLNILDLEYYFNLTDGFLGNNVSGSLIAFNEILEKGFDARNFISGLASHFRDLLVSKDPETIVLLDVGNTIRDKYLQHAAKIPLDFLYEALEICNDTDLQFRYSKNQRLTVELALVKLSNLTMVQKKK